MATLPLSGSNVRLLKGIPFNSDYKHTRWFDNKSEQTNYFLSKQVVHTMDKANFQRIEGKGFIAVNKNIDELWGVNYLMFKNETYPSKWFYAFVTKIEYKQKTTTYVYFEIDVFQTWKFDMNFKPSYVIREHQKLWNADGTPVINTIDEGLDYGSDYEISSVNNILPTPRYKWLVIVSKEILGTNEVGGSNIGTPQPLTYYVVPFDDNGYTPPKIITSDVTYDGVSNPVKVLQAIYSSEESVNNIVNIFVTDYFGVPFSLSGSNLTTNEESPFATKKLIKTANVLMVGAINKFKEKVIRHSKVYEGFYSVKESKLLMHPYCNIMLTDFKGNTIDYKPQYIRNTHLDLIFKGSLGTSNFTSCSIKDYNTRGAIGELKDQVSNEVALIDTTPNDVPILTDNLSAFLQGNRNTLQNQKNTTMFNGVMSGVSGVTSAVGSASYGNVGGVLGGISNAIKGAGNTVLGLQQIQAKKHDINNIPPNLQKMGSNTAYDYGNRYNGVFVIKKQIKEEYVKKLEHFFNMYGYKINEVKIPNFHTRKYWNYVQTGDCVVRGNFNNEDLVELKSVFDNGITFWHTDDVGNYALNNEVI